ncbi:MAG: ABC transporter ATP-binding protein [Dehalococcoidia bacterium]|nr:ABC transporter ATP-binding protein [Dehalococcoidia bacterium]
MADNTPTAGPGNGLAAREPILSVRDLRVEFRTSRGIVRAVAGVSFDLRPGETLGLVGESGSGKSVTCLSLMRMIPHGAGRIASGQVILNGRDILTIPDKEMRTVRGREIGMILQDPMTSLDPLFIVGEQVRETLRVDEAEGKHRSGWDRVVGLLEMVRIPGAKSRVKAYPHQMSGGMRQRVVAAIALSSEPAVLIADEPTTALDVTIQVQFLDLLKSIQDERHLAMILVTHDLSIVARNCDRVAVMYAGRIVETASTVDLFEKPQHPYTRALLQSVPRLGEFPETLPTIEGQPPDLTNLPAGCPFQPRCPVAMEICKDNPPPVRVHGPAHSSLCWVDALPGEPAQAAAQVPVAAGEVRP